MVHLKRYFLFILAVGHGDDAQYLFQSPPPLSPLSRQQDVHVQDIITTLWTNFAYTG